MRPEPARYAPDHELPPYAFVSPHWPHPRLDPLGHSFGKAEPPAGPLDPARWRESRDLAVGVDLWNRGYYWEAHEAWERLWLAAGRRGPVAELCAALVKLAAAGVKARQGMPDGARIHAGRARAALERLRAEVGQARWCGVDIEALAKTAGDIDARADGIRADPRVAVEVVFEEFMELEEEPAGGPGSARRGA